MPDEGPRRRRRRQHHQAAHASPNPQRNIKGGIVEREGAAARQQRPAGVPRVRQDDPHRSSRGRRPQGARSAASAREWSTNESPERAVPEGSGAGAEEGVRLRQRDGDPARREGRHQHGARRGDVQRQARRRRRRRDRPHHRPEGRGAPRHQVDRAVQAAPGHADRRHGDAARRADVRVPRPPDQHRAAARPRLPRRVAEGLRRPRQLHDGAARTSCCSRKSTT